jgi:choline dehydrogenase-like flavoprotein
VPQKHLANRKLNYARGKTLGGSSNINFCCWTRGSKDDFDEWARVVGDDRFNWENAERRFKKLEGFSPVTNESHKEFANWKAEAHGTDGPVKISDSAEWENNQKDVLIAGYENGWEKNLDVNSGNPLGMAVCPSTGVRGLRTTAKTAYLMHAPENLVIITDAAASKILFEGKKAVGVTAGGKDYFATKELILSAGALDSPKLLMLSGIGPQAELDKHNIPVRANLPVGLGLQDHLHFPQIVEIEEGTNLRAKWSTPDAIAAASEQVALDGTGPLSIMYNSCAIGFAKGSSSLYQSKEFKDLPEDIQAYIKKPTVPTYEVISVIPTAPVPGVEPGKTYQAVSTFGMVPQSRGTVTLQSADPADPPVSDPNFFSHPFDRKALIDGVRQSYKWLHNPRASPTIIKPIAIPKSLSDEDIADFIANYGVSTWHMSCSAKMGKPNDPTAVLTTDFKVKGFAGLRVVDLSAIPFVPNAHTVSTAYLVGETGAEFLSEEHSLN